MVNDDKTTYMPNGYNKKNGRAPAKGLSEIFGNTYKELGEWIGQKYSSLGQKFSYKPDKREEARKEELAKLTKEVREKTKGEGFAKNLEDGVNLHIEGKEPSYLSLENMAVRYLNESAVKFVDLHRDKYTLKTFFHEIVSPMSMRKRQVKNSSKEEGHKGPYAMLALEFGKFADVVGKAPVKKLVGLMNLTSNPDYQKEKEVHLGKSLKYSSLGSSLLTTAAIYSITHFDKLRNLYEYYINNHHNIKNLYEGVAILTGLAGGFGAYFLGKGIRSYFRHKALDNRVVTIYEDMIREGIKNGKRS